MAIPPAAMNEPSKSTSQDDPDSGPGADVRGPPSPNIVEPSAAAAVQRDRGHVRFNSNAATTKPRAAASAAVPGPAPQHRDVLVPKPRPSILRGNSLGSVTTARDTGDGLDPTDSEKAISAVAAQARAQRVAAKLRRGFAKPDSINSLESHAETANSDGEPLPHDDQGISLGNLGHTAGATVGHSLQQTSAREEREREQAVKEVAYDLVQAHTRRFAVTTTPNPPPAYIEAAPNSHGVPSEVNGGIYDGVYNVPPPPAQYRGSVLSQLFKLYKLAEPSRHQQNRQKSASSVGGEKPASGSGSGGITPTRRKWYEQNRSQDTLATLVEASTRLANPHQGADRHRHSGKRWPLYKRTANSSRPNAHWQREEICIAVHIAETLSRQGYIIKLCRALMLYGAPTHRLEEYLGMTARVLEIDGQFLYLPGCMIISFDDKSTHTTDVSVVRTAQDIDLGKLKAAHHVYKEVMHDVIGVQEGTRRLEALMSAREKFGAWARVLIFGLTSATCAPFSFQARLVDLPLCFLLGCLVGLLQLFMAPRSSMYSNVFEVSAAVLVSFLARAFGSIAGGKLFCFSALTQSGIVMLLPGYSLSNTNGRLTWDECYPVCSALELQSRAIVPGSIRIVYAIVYSLLLGFGITIGAALYGLVDADATSAPQCENQIPSHYGFIFVPFFVLCISMLYQAEWRQMPAMVVIAFAGHIVNYFSSLKFAASPQIASTLGALSVGVLANLYSRLRHGVAAATLIPAIFTQVPGGLASLGGLLSGLRTANELTKGNGTSQDVGRMKNVVFDVAASMIQIAIGIAVGLFISAFIVYPLGKRRSGLFSF
ncbi:DUF1212 domain membrane protein Prm10 [Tolypocladium paradoxum]|uniref:DUF1212 domain membrane protein Prm10 n=1 Tax=Tolypocladium paradoxum TaxID=94208 RepID=A0A2S4KU75_9HYPO|nr:DUF1212 domain membrane protein Prm10 [Tolypocladium paradoxum]